MEGEEGTLTLRMAFLEVEVFVEMDPEAVTAGIEKMGL